MLRMFQIRAVLVKYQKKEKIKYLTRPGNFLFIGKMEGFGLIRLRIGLLKIVTRN